MAVALLMLMACNPSMRRSGAAQEPKAPATENAALTDASYDWHSLVIAPFGTLLKEIPFPLHEVLLFHDDSHAAADSDGADCHGIEGVPPRFVGREPDEYSLCFDHDRLARIEVSVRLATDEASKILARACVLWTQDSTSLPAGAKACEGRDGDIAWSARWVSAADGSPPGTAVPLSMTLKRQRSPGP